MKHPKEKQNIDQVKKQVGNMMASTSLFARGTNLLDEEYEQVYGYQTPGRAGYLGIRLSFGQ